MTFRHSFFKQNLNKTLIAISKQKTYLKTLRDKTSVSGKINNREKFKKSLRSFEFIEIKYFLTITITKSNLYLNVSDSSGRLKLSVSSRNLFSRIEQKQKSLKVFAVDSIIRSIYKQKYLKRKPLALSFKTISWPRFIPQKLFRILNKEKNLRVVNYFANPPFNGCRKKKVRTR
jgi:hypothetical protein